MKKLAHLSAGILIGILLTTLAFSQQSPTQSLDPAKLAPQIYRVLLDNNKLRVIDYHLAPGEQEPLHSHPNGAVVYFFTDSHMQPASGGNESFDHAGSVIWRDPVTHAGKNSGSSEIHGLLIEPRSPPK